MQIGPDQNGHDTWDFRVNITLEDTEMELWLDGEDITCYIVKFITRVNNNNFLS